MSKGKFEQELQALLANHEVDPPTSNWAGILRKLNKTRYFLGGGILLLGALITIGFCSRAQTKTIPTITGSIDPVRLIMMIDTSYYENGTFRLDTIYQILPKFDRNTTSKPRLMASKKIDESWLIADPEHPQYVDAESYEKGRELFTTLCATCHVDKSHFNRTDHIVAPQLANITARREQQWLYDFTRNSQKMIQSGDPQAVALWEDWRPTQMNNFEQLEDQELHDIYYYVANWELSD